MSEHPLNRNDGLPRKRSAFLTNPTPEFIFNLVFSPCGRNYFKCDCNGEEWTVSCGGTRSRRLYRSDANGWRQRTGMNFKPCDCLSHSFLTLTIFRPGLENAYSSPCAAASSPAGHSYSLFLHPTILESSSSATSSPSHQPLRQPFLRRQRRFHPHPNRTSRWGLYASLSRCRWRRSAPHISRCSPSGNAWLRPGQSGRT